MKATTRLMPTGAMCSGAPGVWTPTVGVLGHSDGANAAEASLVTVSGIPFLR